MKILVAGMVAADPHQGGATWAVLQYVLGLERLGHEVWLVDPAEPRPEARRYFDALELGPRASLGEYRGPVPEVLLNVSGLLRDEKILGRAPIRVYLDLDPVFNQLWHLQGVDAGLEGHTHYVSLGMRLPETGHEWAETLPPVVLERWPLAGPIDLDALTTVGNWRSYGTIEHGGIRYGLRAHSLRQFVELPRLTGERIALALRIHPDETRDLEALREYGWELIDPDRAAGTPARYGDFVRGSRAELGIAKEGYAVSRSGWFSDRSACYLASGRPVVAQDTGFGERLPSGAGLLAFTTVEEAAAAIAELRRDYGRHARAARAIAEEYLDSDVVLTRLLRLVGAVPAARSRALREAPIPELAQLVGRNVLARRPFEYRSSSPILELEVEGEAHGVLVKDLGRSALAQLARRAKPALLYDPLREIEVYRSLLAGEGLGTARLYGALVEPERDRYWLAIEKVGGVELYQVGELERWESALRWLARLHDRFAGRTLPGSLLRYDERFFLLWWKRARELSGLDGLEGYTQVARRLGSLPKSLLHGDLYASNVLVADGRVCPVDWELAAAGPGVVDVAALTMGWPDEERLRLAGAYHQALASPPPYQEWSRDLDRASLHLAVQWLGWSREWSPPPEHARDFRADANRFAERVL
jgi:Phosphotransferase enzyme family